MTSKLPIPGWYLALICTSLPLLVPAYLAHTVWEKCGNPPKDVEQPALPKRRGRRRALSVAEEKPSLGEDGCGFWKLPYELREIIWRELFLVDDPHPARIRFSENGTRLAMHPSKSGYPSIGLLKTNRQFYREGIRILYSSTEFHILEANVLTSFARQVAPSHLAQIQKLHFEVSHMFFDPIFSKLHNLAWHKRTWQRACKHLELFTGLRDLKVTIRVNQSSNVGAGWMGFGGGGWKKEVLEPLLGPLTKVRVCAGGTYVVEYPWPEGVCDTWPGATFELRRIGQV